MSAMLNQAFAQLQYIPRWKKIINEVDALEEDTGDSQSTCPTASIGAILRDNISWIMSNDSFSSRQKSVASAIASCRTSMLGGFLQYCPNCQKYVSYQYCSCNNRNCPQCQFTVQKKWCMLRKSEIIPGIPYYHIVLTLPHELNDLVLANEKLLLTNLFRSSAQSVLQMCRDPQILGATPGIISALHSWSSDLLQHYHVHMLVTGGGLDKNDTFVNLIDLRKCQKRQKNRVSKSHGTLPTDPSHRMPAENIEPSDESYTYFMPLRALTDLFRGIFMAEMRDMYSKHKLKIPESMKDLEDPFTWSSFCHNLCHLSWVGHLAHSFGPEVNDFDRMGEYMTRSPMTENRIVTYDTLESSGQSSFPDVIEYMGRFVSATAITSNRITDYSGKTVTFLGREKDGTGYHKSITLGVYAFISRFLSHILPKGFARIRSYGIFSNAQKNKNLISIFKQLTGTVFTASKLNNVKGRELVRILFPNNHFDLCPFCKGALQPVPFGNCPPWLARGQPA